MLHMDVSPYSQRHVEINGKNQASAGVEIPNSVCDWSHRILYVTYRAQCITHTDIHVMLIGISDTYQ